MRSHRWAAVLIAVLVFASCGDSTNRIAVDGSSTVFPITEAMAEEFSRVSRTAVRVGFSGTGGGFEKLCRGEIQVAAASRPVKAAEREKCAAGPVGELVEFRVAIDALSVVVHPRNDFATCMTVDELRLIFKTDGAERWSDVRPEWPDRQIRRYFPGPDSGTFDYFNEAIIRSEPGATHSPRGTASEDDNVLLFGIAGDLDAIGYFGFAHFQESHGRLKAVAIDGGHGCEMPSVESATSGAYTPLSRPLYLYTGESLLAESEAVRTFLTFVLDNAWMLVPETGYIALPEAEIDAQRPLLRRP
jgi:phosphate transport system substrate-binding protein